MDIARLGLAVDSSPVVKAANDLDKLKTSATGAGVAVDHLGDEADQTGASLRTMGAAANARPLDAYAGSIARVGRGAGITRQHLGNMAFQLNDVAVTAAMGMNPLMILIQQGSQIGQIAGQAGVGIGAWAKALGLLNPFVLAAAAAAGIAVGAFTLFKNEINDTSGNEAFVKSLGLTDKELKKLGDTSVTIGDMFSGLWRTIDEGRRFSGLFKTIGDAAVTAFKTVLDWGGKAFIGLNAAVWATIKAIEKGFKYIPGVISEAFYNGVNLAITGLEWLLNQSIAVLQKLGLNIEKTTLPRIRNSFTGTAAYIGDVWYNEFQASFQRQDAMLTSFQKKWTANSIAASRERISANAKALIDARNTADAASKVANDMRKRNLSVRGKNDWLWRGDIGSVGDQFGFKDRKPQAVGSIADNPVGMNLKNLPQMINPARDAFMGLGREIAYAATSGQNFFSSLTQGLASLAQQFAQTKIMQLFGNMAKAFAGRSGGGGWLSRGLNEFFNPEVPSYAGGGYTGNGPRSGGLDGKGGFWAMMRPQETVHDWTKGAPASTGRTAQKQNMTISLQSKFDIAGAVGRGEIADGIVQAQKAAVDEAIATIKKQFPAMSVQLGQLGTVN